jgi:hypothetical protein
LRNYLSESIAIPSSRFSEYLKSYSLHRTNSILATGIYTAAESWSLGPLESNSPVLPVSAQNLYSSVICWASQFVFLFLILFTKSKVE